MGGRLYLIGNTYVTFFFFFLVLGCGLLPTCRCISLLARQSWADMSQAVYEQLMQHISYRSNDTAGICPGSQVLATFKIMSATNIFMNNGQCTDCD